MTENNTFFDDFNRQLVTFAKKQAKTVFSVFLANSVVLNWCFTRICVRFFPVFTKTRFFRFLNFHDNLTTVFEDFYGYWKFLTQVSGASRTRLTKSGGITSESIQNHLKFRQNPGILTFSRQSDHGFMITDLRKIDFRSPPYVEKCPLFLEILPILNFLTEVSGASRTRLTKSGRITSESVQNHPKTCQKP